MTTRREFIQSLAAASALPIGSVTRVGANSNHEKRVESAVPLGPLYRFLVDDRFPESVSAGRAAAEQGTVVHLMKGGDITPFWFHDLSLRWGQAPAAVAGVTGHGPLFVLEHLAWDHGMRVTVREEHPRGPDSADAEPLFTWLIGPGSGLSKVSPQT
jgi:hypothetical protein